MTRDFNKQRRDDPRPPSRHSSPGNYRAEQPFKPVRPRLSRDTVDRAWESGATRKYADYRPRQNAPRPPLQQRPAPPSDRSRPPQQRGNYETRQDNYRAPSSSSHHGYDQRRQRPSDVDQRHFNEPGNRAPGYSGPHNSPWTRDQRGSTPYQENRRYQDERPPRFRQTGPGGPTRNNYQAGNGPRRFERSDREQENFARGQRTGNSQGRRDNYNPRWQSRPSAQRDYPAPRRPYPQEPRRDGPYERPELEQFEGDYERFASYERTEQGEHPERAFEQHVTRLPDGRVLKGPRPAQRKQARFWNEVAKETSILVPSSPTVQENPEQTMQPSPQTRPATRPTRSRKPPAGRSKTIKTVKAARSRDTGPRSSQERARKKKARGAQGPVTRPSQHGFKWPTSGE